MKKILFIISMLISFAYAQNPTGVESQRTGKWLKAYGYVTVDSGLHFAMLDTSNKPATGYSTLKFILGVPYYWNGTAYSSFSGGGSVPGGPNTSVQYNNSGVLGGETGFEYNSTANKLLVDSLTSKTIRASNHLVLPSTDSLLVAAGRGDIIFDTLRNNVLFRAGNQWVPINALMPAESKVRIYAGVLRPVISSGVITWNFLAPNTQHDSIGVTGVGVFNNTINVRYPHFSQVISSAITIDETLSRYGISVGASVGVDSALISVHANSGSQGGYWRGNGTTFVSTGLTGWAVSYTVGTGTMTFTPSTYGSTTISVGAENIQFNYVGSNGYKLVRKLSALGSNFIGFTMVDDGGNPVTTVPTTDDIINVMAANAKIVQMNPGVVSGSNIEPIIFGSTSNIWVIIIGRL